MRLYQSPASARSIGTRLRPLHAALVVVALSALGFTAGCQSMFRYRAPGVHPGYSVDEARMAGMNPFVLTNLVFDRHVIEIDWIEGAAPTENAVRGLRKIAEKYAPEGLETEIVLDDEIPRAEWDALDPELRGVFGLTQYVDTLPSLESRTEVTYVLYAPRSSSSDSLFGYVSFIALERGDRDHVVTTIHVFQDANRDVARLWISPRRIDRMTLVHEYGHVLGLVSNRLHEERGNLKHCRNPDCVLVHARFRHYLWHAMFGFLGARLPYDYCRECRRDITQAQALWAGSATADPEFASELLTRWQIRRSSLASELFEQAGDLDRAMTHARRTVELEADSAHARLRLASVLARRGSTMEAIRVYREAIDVAETDRQRDRGRLELAQTLCVVARYDEAADVLEGLETEWVSQGTVPPAVLSWALVGTARFEEAAEIWQNVFGERRDANRSRSEGGLEAYARYQVARLLRRSGNVARARAFAEAQDEAGAEYPGWPLERARLDLADGKTESAGKRLRAVIDMTRREQERLGEKTQNWIWSMRARAHALLGEREEARDMLARSQATLERVSDSVKLGHAGVLAMIGDTDESFALLESLGDEFRPWGGTSDPCLIESFAPLRDTSRFHELFPRCGENDVDGTGSVDGGAVPGD